MLAKGLRDQSYAVDIAQDGEEAGFKASVNQYDLILLDAGLPHKDGFRVCHELRSEGSEVPILMLTARDAYTDRVRGLDLGADDYLTKPYDYGELLARVRALLRRGPRPHQENILVADLRIDVRGRHVWRAGRAIELTAKEYAPLEYFARRAGELITREDISQPVWDESYDPFSNVIEVYIRRLRLKIDSTHAAKLLHTRRGEGYVLCPDGTEEPASS